MAKGGGSASKAYDRAYFDRWYRDPRARVATHGSVARKARLVLGVAEALLERPVRSVLDVGCGEGAWRAPLKRLRPRVRYAGVDSSVYVVERFGARRNIVRGTFGELALLAESLGGPFDLIVCCDLLQYVPDAELRRGLSAVAALLGGVTYLEAYANEDDIEGDRRGWHRRTARFYTKEFRHAGFTGVGMHCWVGEELAHRTATLEHSGR